MIVGQGAAYLAVLMIEMGGAAARGVHMITGQDLREVARDRSLLREGSITAVAIQGLGLDQDRGLGPLTTVTSGGIVSITSTRNTGITTRTAAAAAAMIPEGTIDSEKDR